MGHQTFRLNLGSSEFPFLHKQYGQSIIYPQQDMHYIRPNAFSGAEADKNIGIPQLIFCENVMPSINGYQSVGFLVPIQGTAFTDFDMAFYLRDATENGTLFVPGESGGTMKRYTYDQSSNTWSTSNKAVPAGAKCTVCNVKSRTFVHAEFDDEFWEWTGVWGVVVFAGITATNIKGLVSANAYNILYDYNTIYWSSTVDPTDFLPSLITGAGSSRVLAIKGRIVFCEAIEDGFIIYATKNTVIAKYSQNARFPWNFKEIKNSAGLVSQEHASSGGDNNNNYVWTAQGLMSYGPIRADQVFPIVSEFIGEREIEVYNKATKNIDTVTLTDQPVVKVDFLANRYLVISYGQTSLMSHALIYDSALKRWGKIRVDHVDAFEFSGNPGVPGNVASLTWAQLSGTWAQQNVTWFEYGAIISGGAASIGVPYRALGFLGKDGQVKVVSFEYADTTDVSVMYLGKLQFLRNNLWTIQDIEAERMQSESQTKLAILTTLDGTNFLPAVYPFKKLNAGTLQKWECRLTGRNHTLRFEGNFHLYSIVASGKEAGQR